MTNIVTDFIRNTWTTGRRTKLDSKGWLVSNAVCCIHNGETADRRGRGGLIVNADGDCAYYCFNCHYKTSFQPGRHLSFKMRKLLNWMGAEDVQIKRIALEALRLKDEIGLLEPEAIVKEEIKFKTVELPTGATAYHEIVHKDIVPDDFYACVQYVSDRRIDFGKYDFYWANEKVVRMRRRVIVPYTWHNEVIGYTGRAIDADCKPKYFNQVDSGYVFNIDKQQNDWKFVIVCEGPFDAMSIDGVSVNHNLMSEQQIDIIESLGREVILVPDNEKSGLDLVKQAIECGWSVSRPVWFDEEYKCKDINDAVCKFGKLFTLKAIIEGKETNPLTIKLLFRKWTNKKFGK